MRRRHRAHSGLNASATPATRSNAVSIRRAVVTDHNTHDDTIAVSNAIGSDRQ
jgi:hypothetical protein